MKHPLFCWLATMAAFSLNTSFSYLHTAISRHQLPVRPVSIIQRKKDTQSEFYSIQRTLVAASERDQVLSDEQATPASVLTDHGSKATASVAYQGLSPDGGWITDPWAHGVLWSLKVERTLRDITTPYQHLQILDTGTQGVGPQDGPGRGGLGRVLVLDGAVQVSEACEASYHEMLVHVPLCRKGAGASTQEGTKRVLVVGGGDGGSAREALRHPDVGHVDFVDIDAEVLRASRELLPSIWRHPHSTADQPLALEDDPRLNIRVMDGFEFLKDAEGEGYDLIVVDASDPVGPGSALYTDSFYASLRARLRPGGAVSVQGGSFWYLPAVFRTVYHGLKSSFPVVKPYQCFTSVYPGGIWNLQVATLGDDPAEVDPEKVSAITGAPLEWYTAHTHAAAFHLPPIAYAALEIPPAGMSAAGADSDGSFDHGSLEQKNNVESSSLLSQAKKDLSSIMGFQNLSDKA